MQRNIGLALLVISISFQSSLSRAADYVGATAVLKRVSDPSTASATNQNPSAAAQLKSDIESFKKQSGSLKPEDAAQQWLKLLDRQFDLSPEDLSGGYQRSRQQFNPNDIWLALPPPAAWDSLRRAIEARPPQKSEEVPREFALKLIAHTLTADHAAQTADISQLLTLAVKSDDQDPLLIEIVNQINQSFSEKSSDPDAILKSLERRLVANENEYSPDFSVPNLVPIVGEQRASAFIRRVFTNSTFELSVVQGEETKQLARKLALEMVANLKAPQWELACSLDGGPLFEALEKKFAPSEPATNQAPDADALESLAALGRKNRSSDPHSSYYLQARVYYLLNLISKGRTQEAMALAQKIGGGESYYLPGEAFSDMQRAGYGKPLNDFLHEILSQHPALPFWEYYIPLAVQLGQSDKMLELARKSAARDDLNDTQRNSIREYLYSALLAADQVDEGVAEMRRILAQPPATGRSRYGQSSKASVALTLAKIGQLTGNTNWLDEGIRLARQEISKSSGSSDFYGESSTVKQLAAFLVDIGSGPEAESILSDDLMAKRAQVAQSEYKYAAGPYLQGTMAGLVSVYYRAGRYADVVTLLDQAPDWGVKDLADLHNAYLDNVHQHEDSAADSVRHDVAASLLNLGRVDEAKKIANAILDENGGYDPAYEILVKAGGSEVIQRLDQLFGRDQFEERPLIWKAVVLQQNGKLEEAEAAARKAISIDPSDGEQGPGRRMRAYAVLSDIRKARGDEKEAETFRGIVDAIRLSEKADGYYQAGLLTQAIAMYEDSLSKFDGAYCIQSRLALRLTEAGKHEEAAEHYRRAYELMPDSFGRVESHCFGCEAAFSGREAQSIADKVFTSLAKSDPRKPQVHYLLGYLREEQGNYSEALTHFRDAVKLDPDYLNAWKHIDIVGKEYFLSAADQDAIAFNGIRLDPLSRHAGWTGTGKVTDLRKLWSVVETAVQLRPKLAEALYPLAASKAAIEKQGAEASTRQREYESWGEDSRIRDRGPAQIIVQNEMISKAIQLLQRNRFGVGID
jgi:tetratricopeptide (TPR) repeat protein